jgi:hypothetical protein
MTGRYVGITVLSIYYMVRARNLKIRRRNPGTGKVLFESCRRGPCCVDASRPGDVIVGLRKLSHR